MISPSNHFHFVAASLGSVVLRSHIYCRGSQYYYGYIQGRRYYRSREENGDNGISRVPTLLSMIHFAKFINIGRQKKIVVIWSSHMDAMNIVLLSKGCSRLLHSTGREEGVSRQIAATIKLNLTLMKQDVSYNMYIPDDCWEKGVCIVIWIHYVPSRNSRTPFGNFEGAT